MHLNQLKYFVAIVKHGSFWSAALEEYISQSSISKQIKALENELGVILFERSGNKTSLTEAGKCFYEYAMEVLGRTDDLLNDLSQYDKKGEENISFASIPIMGAYKISNLLSEFQKENKDFKQVINYNIFEEEQKNVVFLLKNDKVSFAFLRDEFNKLTEYEHRLFLTDEIGMICSKKSPLAQLKQFDFAQIADEKIIMISPKSEVYLLVNERLKEAEREENIVATTTRHRNLLSMVADNVGITFFAKRMMQDADMAEQLVFVPLKLPIYSNIYVVRHKKRGFNIITEKFWQFLCNRYPEYQPSHKV
ncbi:MAG: LysR family transcriptional regulator [Phascolarctobacterium sp.]|nr:LysR family transcriptional regulator [Phascolarctobacterium sp.]